jgi:hypothetical protein
MKGTTDNRKLDGEKKLNEFIFVYKSSTDFNANSGLS